MQFVFDVATLGVGFPTSLDSYTLDVSFGGVSMTAIERSASVFQNHCSWHSQASDGSICVSQSDSLWQVSPFSEARFSAWCHVASRVIHAKYVV